MTTENPGGLEVRIPDKSRKLSLSLNARGIGNGTTAALLGGVSTVNSGGPIGVSHNRKRSMSGNMVLPPLTSSRSEDHLASNLDALNLNLIDEMGEDPPLLPCQYISTSRFLSLSNKEVERERQLLVRKQSQPGLWTNMTPV